MFPHFLNGNRKKKIPKIPKKKERKFPDLFYTNFPKKTRLIKYFLHILLFGSWKTDVTSAELPPPPPLTYEIISEKRMRYYDIISKMRLRHWIQKKCPRHFYLKLLQRSKKKIGKRQKRLRGPQKSQRPQVLIRFLSKLCCHLSFLKQVVKTLHFFFSGLIIPSSKLGFLFSVLKLVQSCTLL